VNRFPRLDILPAAQRTLWPQLADVSRHSFVLYGGTAVALYLGHRESVDFDFFTNVTFQPDDLAGSYFFLREGEILQSQQNTLTVITEGRETSRVKNPFFGGLKFGRLAQPRNIAERRRRAGCYPSRCQGNLHVLPFSLSRDSGALCGYLRERGMAGRQ
jgi:hypothetical protein